MKKPSVGRAKCLSERNQVVGEAENAVLPAKKTINLHYRVERSYWNGSEFFCPLHWTKYTLTDLIRWNVALTPI